MILIGKPQHDTPKYDFSDSNVLFAFFRMTTGDSLSVRTKFCFLTWIGEKGGPLAKARAGPNKRILQQVITVSQFITPYINYSTITLNHAI